MRSLAQKTAEDSLSTSGSFGPELAIITEPVRIFLAKKIELLPQPAVAPTN
jgi:hypothetical protein